jgi:toxin ParE1/3/4
MSWLRPCVPCGGEGPPCASGQARRVQSEPLKDRKRAALGDAFLDELGRVIALLKAHPNAWPIIFAPEFRRARLNRFPYAVVYRVLPDEIVVVAVQHLKRRPDAWKRRRNLDADT